MAFNLSLRCLPIMHLGVTCKQSGKYRPQCIGVKLRPKEKIQGADGGLHRIIDSRPAKRVYSLEMLLRNK